MKRRKGRDPLPERRAFSTPGFAFAAGPRRPSPACPNHRFPAGGPGPGCPSLHCVSGVGASAPVHAAVSVPQSDWTTRSKTSSAEHPCRHDNLCMAQRRKKVHVCLTTQEAYARFCITMISHVVVLPLLR